MPRIRSIKPEMWHDEKLGNASVHARLLFVGVITQADDEGRLRGNPALIAGQVFPYDQLSARRVDAWLAELADRDLIVRYTVEEETFIALPAWRRHQRINRRSPSTIPPPPGWSESAAEDDDFETSTYKKVRVSERVRREVARRYGATPGTQIEASCEECGAVGTIDWTGSASWVTFSGLELDHREPEATGGSGEADNVQLLCRPCNRQKGSTETRSEPVRNPVGGVGDTSSRPRARAQDQGEDQGEESLVGPERPDEERSPIIDSPQAANPDVLRLSRLLASLIAERDPKASPSPQSVRWLRAMRLLLTDRDGDVAEVERVLRWSQADTFWQANILSPDKLRTQFSQLLQKSRGPQSTNGGKPENEWDRVLAAASLKGGAA